MEKVLFNMVTRNYGYGFCVSKQQIQKIKSLKTCLNIFEWKMIPRMCFCKKINVKTLVIIIIKNTNNTNNNS